MKKFMKKALAVLVVLSMLCMPVFVNAATGDTVPMPENFIWNNSTVSVGAGETVYFEISTEGSTGEFDFVVEGSGKFVVSVCSDGYLGGDGQVYYVEGKPVSSVGGKVQTTIISFDETYMCGAFSITNMTAKTVDYTCSIVYPEGSMGNPKSVELSVGETVYVTVPAGGDAYWIGATLPALEKEYVFKIKGASGFAYSQGLMPLNDTNGVCETTIAAYFGPATFSITNSTSKDQTYALTIENMPLGSESNPDYSFVADTEYKLKLNGNSYWYSWIAPETGTLTFTVDTAVTENWTYTISNNSSYLVLNYSTAWNEHDAYTKSMSVSAGDVISIGVSIPVFESSEWGDYWDAYGTGTGTFAFSTSFVAGGGEGGDPEIPDVGGEGGEDPDTYIDVGANYIHYGEYVNVGTGVYNLSSLYDYTLFTFYPGETGIFSISTTDAVMAIISYNGMWTQFDPSEETVYETSFEWDSPSEYSEIWIAVKADSGAATITVNKSDAEVKETEYVDYVNGAEIAPFTFTGDTAALLSVVTMDNKVDSAVLGSDGYYHLNDANGPVLYANLSDSMMSLTAAASYGQLKWVDYDEEGFAVQVIDYTNAFNAYAECADSKTHLYPLTEDLITIFQNVGKNYNWYGEGGWVGGKYEDAWMFACYYNELPEISEDPSTAIATGSNYIHYGNKLSVGVHEEILSSLYDYTIFTFAPGEIGNYTITVDGGCAGIVSYNAMWATVTPSESTVTAAGAVWECSAVGQKIWVAVRADANPATITIEREEIVIKVVEKIVYENKQTPEAFTYAGSADDLIEIDTLDNVCQQAVLGSDGYYHLDTADGPILYANLDSTLMSLYAAVSNGQLKDVLYDSEGEVIAVIDYNDAFTQYYNCKDKDTSLYPLTEDLMAIYQNAGRNLGWYGQNGWVGGKYDDAWMFALCYTEKSQFKLGDCNGDGNVNSIDSNLLVRMVTGQIDSVIEADINCDGNVNSIDSNLMVRMIAGFYSPEN